MKKDEKKFCYNHLKDNEKERFEQKMKNLEKGVFTTHNQGVPGSSPGGPT